MNQPPQQPTPYSSNDDEISLVDLAKMLIRRWKLMAVTFLIIVGIALGYALMMERTYDYVSLYRVAEQAPSSSNEQGNLESPAAIVAKTNNLYAGVVTRRILEEKGLAGLPFQLQVSALEDTSLVRFVTESSEKNAALVEEMHSRVLERAAEDQQALLESRKATLQRQLENAQRALETAQESTSPSAAELVANYATRVAEIEDQLAQLHPGELVQTAVRSLTPTGTSRSLVMALALVLAGMLAVMMAFFSHFAVAVRDSLQEE
ncbi:Wzz/FepE/Etk N-terminal domain-containing protein [Halomonas sp. SSL-5]|uniref:Wzz/FepE/Etk N-terminal domain-containing protein n=1 Tax=Halomonas sp. SSL-5 TaxID=3065855 RepID=UPI002738D735|nr:Wzz/FepE/Etk N-terminal domain-containing protein [Halomonas sp. SSL-5]MDY7116698.1 Wzz/FepE/Etk N-terminal domain-containing protein [Halomonas sp. SSL-5]